MRIFSLLSFVDVCVFPRTCAALRAFRGVSLQLAERVLWGPFVLFILPGTAYESPASCTPFSCFLLQTLAFLFKLMVLVQGAQWGLPRVAYDWQATGVRCLALPFLARPALPALPALFALPALPFLPRLPRLQCLHPLPCLPCLPCLLCLPNLLCLLHLLSPVCAACPSVLPAMQFKK